MLRFLGPASTHCDRITRRDCLTLGALGLGGLTLPGLLRLRAAAGETAPGTVVRRGGHLCRIGRRTLAL